MRHVLFAYALAAVIALLVLGVVLQVQANATRRQLVLATMELDQAVHASEACEVRLRSMQDEQLRNRALYTPEQAVQASFAVQRAQEACDSAIAKRDVATQKSDALRKTLDIQTIWLLPCIALWLIHAILALMVRPQRRSSAGVRL